MVTKSPREGFCRLGIEPPASRVGAVHNAAGPHTGVWPYWDAVGVSAGWGVIYLHWKERVLGSVGRGLLGGKKWDERLAILGKHSPSQEQGL